MTEDDMRLPDSVQEIADVIGRERALYLVSQLPRFVRRDGRYVGATATQVILYVPKHMRPDHELVRILGWHDAQKLAQEFAGMILKPALCANVERDERNRRIRTMHTAGEPLQAIADAVGLSTRQVRNILCMEIPQEAGEAANDNTAPTNTNEIQRQAR